MNFSNLSFYLKKITAFILTIIFILLFLVLDYWVPRSSIVDISGVDIKLVNTEQGVIDIFMIQTKDTKGRPRVFRNQDAWGFLKFDSADLQAIAARESRNDNYVQIRHYGWRIQILSMFPNALSIKDVFDSDAIIFPTRLIVFLITISFWIYIMKKLKLFQYLKKNNNKTIASKYNKNKQEKV